MENNTPNLEYTPQSSTPQQAVDTLANRIKAKYPLPDVNRGVQSAPASSPASLLQGSGRKKLSFKDKNVSGNEIYKQLSDGSFEARYDNYISGTNNSERLARQQSTGEKWANGLQKFVGKTSTAIAGGTIGSVVGLGELISTGSLEAMYNNDFNKWLDTLNEKMDMRLPNYYTQQEQNEGFIDSLDNANFWANDFLGGLSFTVGSIVSEAIWAYATGGASLIARGARLGARMGVKGFKTAADLAKANSTASRVGKELLRSGQFNAKNARRIGQTVEGLNTARFIYTSAGYEAGVEARSYMREAEEQFLSTFERQNGRKPNPQELAAFKADLHESANTVFAANTALVGASNLAVFGNMFNLPSMTGGLTKSLNKSLFGIGHKTVSKEGRTVLEALNPTKLQKFTGKTYSVLKAPVIEGMWEEGMQAVTSNGAENWLMSRYDADATKENLDIIESAYNGFAHTYGTKEGWKEIGLGMLIGFVGGGVSSGFKFNDVSQTRKSYNQDLANMNTFSAENTLEAFRVQNQINKAEKDIEKAEAENDMLGRDMATRRLFYTHARANERFGKTDAAEDFAAAMESLDDSYYESMGIDPKSETFEQEKAALKETMLSEYKAMEGQYKTNRKAAEYLVGRGSITGVENTEELVEAVAYNISMGKDAHTFSKSMFDQIKTEMAGVMGGKLTEAIEAQTVLDRAHKRTRERFYYHKKQAKKAERDLENALEDMRKLETQSRDTNIDIDTRIRKAQANIVKYTERRDQEREKMRQVFGMAKAENPYAGDTIYETSTDPDINTLEKTEEFLQQGEEYLENLKETNPTKYHALKKLFSEYHRANYAFKQFNDTVQGLANDQLKLQEYNDFISKKVYKGKKNNEFTQEWIDQNLKAYRDAQRGVIGDIAGSQAISQADKKMAIEDKLYNGEDLSEEEKEFYNEFKEEIDHNVMVKKVGNRLMEDETLDGDFLKFYDDNKADVDAYIREKEKGASIPTPQTPKEKPKTLKDRIEQAIKNDTAVQAYVGENMDEVVSQKPTMEDIAEFEMLENNPKSDPSIKSGKKGHNGVEQANFTDPNVVQEGLTIDGKHYNVVTNISGRSITLVSINGVLVPYYLTTGAGGKGLKPGWYPFFGIGNDGWMNKTDKSDMETYYERYWGAEVAGKVKEVAEQLNQTYGTDPKVFKSDKDSSSSKPMSSFSDKVETYLDKKLPYKATSNDSTARVNLRRNVENTGKSIKEGFKGKQKKGSKTRKKEASKDRTPEQEKRYQELLSKLSVWRIVDGSIDPGGYSIADMLEAISQENTTPNKNNIKEEVTEEEAINLETVDDKNGTKTIENTDFIQTYENVKVKVNKNKKSFVFSHLNIGTILSKFSMGQIRYKAPTGQDFEALTKTKLNMFKDREGARFEITLMDGSKVFVRVGEKGRLEISLDDFPKIQGILGMKLVNTNLTKNSYYDVYQEVEVNGEKRYVPMKSEFKLDTVSGAPEAVLEPQELESLSKGEELTFQVNMKSTYNNAFLDRLNAANVKPEDLAKIEEEIKESLEIYVMTSSGKIVGVVKRAPKTINPNKESQVNHLALRHMAAQLFIEQSQTMSAKPIDLGAAVPVDRVLLGTPNLELKDTAEGLVPENIEFSDRALEEVVDFGYKEGDTIKTNSKAGLSGVITAPLSKLGKGEKVPFVVFKHGNKKIAYPVSLITRANMESVNKVADINNTQTLSASEKIVKINEVLLEAGISPKRYHLMGTSATEIDAKIDQVVKDLSERKSAPDLEAWVNGADKSTLKKDAKISIDLTNRPIKSPKLAVAFGNLVFPKNTKKRAGTSVNVPNQNQVNNQLNNC